MYVANVDEESIEEGNNLSTLVKNYASKKNISFVKISSKIEEELSSFEDKKKKITDEKSWNS